MLEHEKKFKRRVYSNFVSDNAILNGAYGSGKKVCIFELIRRAKETKAYNRYNFIRKTNTLLPTAICDIISDFSVLEEYTTDNNPNDIFVNTNVIVVDDLNDHIWKDIHKSYYRDLSTKWITSTKTMKWIMKGKFQRANNYDILFIRSSIYNRMYSNNFKFLGYKQGVNFRFNRFIMHVNDTERTMNANFTWLLTDLNTTNYPETNENLILPVWADKYTCHENQYTIQQPIDKVIKTTITIGTKRRVCLDDEVLNEAKESLEQEDDRVFLVLATDLHKELLAKSNMVKVIKKGVRFHKQKFLDSGKNIILADHEDFVKRTDMNLSFITDVIMYSRPESSRFLYKNEMIERLLCYGRTKDLTIDVRNQSLIEEDEYLHNMDRQYEINDFGFILLNFPYNFDKYCTIIKKY